MRSTQAKHVVYASNEFWTNMRSTQAKHAVYASNEFEQICEMQWNAQNRAMRFRQRERTRQCDWYAIRMGQLLSFVKAKRIRKGYTLHEFECHAQKTWPEVTTEAGWVSEMHFLVLLWAMKTQNYRSDPNKDAGGSPAGRGGHRLSIGHQYIPPAKYLADRPKMPESGQIRLFTSGLLK